MVVVCPVCECVNEQSKCARCDTDLSPLVRLIELPALYCSEGRTLLSQGQVEAAIGKLSVAAALDPENTETREALAEVCQSQASVKTASTDAQTRREGRFRVAIWVLALAVAILAGVPFIGRQAKREPVEERLARARLWLADNADLKNVSAVVAGDAIATEGSVPTDVHLRLVQEGLQRVTGLQVESRDLKIVKPPEPPMATYQVRAGDSYWAIALRRYGTAQVWKAIADANRDRLPPARLLPGDEIVLPVVRISPNVRTRVTR